MNSNANWRTIGPVHLLWWNGTMEVQPCLDDAVRRIGWWTVKSIASADDVLDPPPYHFGSIDPGSSCRAILYDEMGLRIPGWKVEEAALSLGLEKAWHRRGWMRFRREHPYVFRDGPVADTGGGRGRHRYASRRPATVQERRESCILDFDEEADEVGVRIRASRSAANLPTSYDDLMRQQPGSSWKSYRRTQWKGR
jgi:hypothetical protein